MATADPTPSPKALPRSPWRRYAPLGLIGVALGLFLALRLDQRLSLERLIDSRAALQAIIADHPVAAPTAFAALYAALVAISAPGATILTVAAGALFGLWQGAAVAALGASVGACTLFLAARSALGAVLAVRVGPRLQRVLAGFQDNAAGYMLFLRLSPLFPFWLVNLAAALAGVGFGTFLWTTALGILPASVVFSGAGASVDKIAAASIAARQACLNAGGADCGLRLPLSAIVTPQIFMLLIGLSLVALAPVVAKRIRAARTEKPPA